MIVRQLVQLGGQRLQPPTFIGQRQQSAGITAVQSGQQRAHLPAAVQIHGEIVLAGQARHQHRRLAGDSDLVLAVMIRQWCGHRQTLFRQVAQQHQIGGECIVVQGFEDRQHQWRRLLVAILGLN